MIENQCKGNIDRFVTYIITLLLRLAKNGGSDPQVFDKVYEVLINTSCTIFNSEIIVYNQVNALNLDVSKLLVNAREKYRNLVENKMWTKSVHQKGKDYRGNRCKQQPTNIAAPFASTGQDNEISQLKKELKIR